MSSPPNVPYCLLCASPLPDSKQRRNINHGEGLVLKTIMKDLLMGSVNDTENNGNFGLNCDSGGNESLDELLSGYLEFSDVVCKSNCFTSRQ